MTVTWNSGDKSANVTLSGGSLVATTTSASQGAVRANTSFGSGKQYFEVILGTASGSNFGIGWANSTASLSSFIGSDKNGVASYVTSATGAFFFNNGSVGAGTGYAGSIGLTLCIAFDIGGKLIWGRYNNGLWNGSSTADPGTGTGGISLSTINAGPYFPVMCANSSGASVTANFGATSFGYAIPTGFTGLDTNVQAFNASSKFLGYDVLETPTSAAVASKMLGYGTLPPDQTAADASKILGYGPLPPSQNAAVSAKFLAYAILTVTFGKSRVYIID